MFGSANNSTSASALALLDDAFEELLNLDLSTLAGDELLEFVQNLEMRKNRIPTVDQRLVAEVESRGTAREHGCRDTTTLLSQLLRITAHEAADRVHAASGHGSTAWVER